MAVDWGSFGTPIGPGFEHRTFFYCPTRMADILKAHGLDSSQEGILHFIEQSTRQVFRKGTPEKAAIDLAFGPQNLSIQGQEDSNTRKKRKADAM